MNTPGDAPISIAAGQWDSSQMVTQAVPVNVGWNLLALPIQPQPAMTAQSLFDSLNDQSSSGNCTQVSRWYHEQWNSQQFNGYNDFNILPDQGYFMLCGSGSTLTP